MKINELFPGYFKKNENEIKEIFNNCIFVFDTNVLLSFYFYSEHTLEECFKLLTKLKERIYIPYQVAYEFSKNRLNKICDRNREYQEFKKELETFFNKIHSNKNTPLISNKIINELDEIKSRIIDEININIDKYNSLFENDLIFEQINDIFINIFDYSSTYSDLKKLNQLAKERYEEKIPPGYKDDKKSENKYGDFYIWQEILNFSKEHKKNIIFITNDNKEDWWYEVDKKTQGPRPELIKEIKQISLVDFHMYKFENFYNFANEFLSIKGDESVYNEIKEFDIKNNFDKQLFLTSNFIKNFENNYILKNFYRNPLADQKSFAENISQSLINNFKEDNFKLLNDIWLRSVYNETFKNYNKDKDNLNDNKLNENTDNI